MPTEQSTSDTWGAPAQPAPAPPPGRWSGKRIAITVAVAVGIAGAGATAVYAASDSADSGGTSAQGGPGGGMGAPPDGGSGGMGGGPGGMGALSRALHGEFVVPDGDGGYTTELLQNGEVTAISATSVTVESEDGYTKTYTIDADTTAGGDADLSDIAAGDDVTVTADESGTAATVAEAGQMGQAPPGGN